LVKKYLSDTHKKTVFLLVLLLFVALTGLVLHAPSREPARRQPKLSGTPGTPSQSREKSVDRTEEVRASGGKAEQSTADSSPVNETNGKDLPRASITVRGVVVNETGDGVSGAQVFLFPLDASTGSFSCQGQSDGKGAFLINDVPPGDFKLFAQKGTLRSRHVFGSSSGEDIVGVRVILIFTGTIVGVVRDPAGALIPEVTIAMFPAEGSGPQTGSTRSLRSESDGTFQMGGVDLLTPVKLCFSKRGFLDYEERVAFTSGLETYPLEIIMEESGWIHGRVTDEDGNPVSKAKVYLRGMEKFTLQLFQTDRNGFFQAGDLREPLYNLAVLAKDFAPKELNSIPINNPELSIVLTRGASLSGKTFFGQENLSQPFTIEAIPSTPSGIEPYNQFRVRSFYNPENEFIIDRLTPGEYTLKVKSQGWALSYKGPLYVAENEKVEDILIPVEQGIQLGGRVYKGDRGEEVFPSVLVYLVKTAGPYVPFLTEVSDSNGAFMFQGIPQGSYVIVAGRGDFRYKSARFSLERGAEYDEFPIMLKKNPQIDLPASVNPPIAGIGVIVQRFEDVVKIEKVLSGGPAALGGLQDGDLIVEVDQYPVDRLPLSEIVDRMRGAVDTSVMLGIERDGSFFREEVVRNLIGY